VAERPCLKAHPDPAATADGCRLCWLSLFDGRYQKLWGLPVTAPERPTPPPPGVHVTVRYCSARRRWDWSVTDGGRVVGNGSEATEAEAREEAEAVRAGIVSPAPFTPGRRHLLYHVLPVRGNGVWQRNLDQLRWRFPLFDGKKVVAIGVGSATDNVTHRGTLHLDPPDMVREYLDGAGCEFLEFANDPERREVASWAPLWESLEDAAPSDVAFYAHAKGVTRPVNPGVTVHEWARVMYSGNLDFWPEVEASISRHPITGMFKKVGHGFAGSRSAWHYSGSFFWIRVGEALSRYRQIDASWFGNEAWPGLHFHPDAAGCLFHAGRVPTLDLFSYPYVRDRVLSDFRRWALSARRAPAWI